MNEPEVYDILKKYWGYAQFRSVQLEVIRSICTKNDTLLLLATGGGKSICYQVPGLYLGGLTLVVSPLIALMQDQVHQLQSRGIAAAALDATLTFRETQLLFDNVSSGYIKFLYVSPERLLNKEFIERFQHWHVTLIAIDEAHCISQWGHDFRPDYLQIYKLRAYFPNVPVAAFTGSATGVVIDDIKTYLHMKNPVLIKGTFMRKNLIYGISKTENTVDKIKAWLTRIPGSAIIYTALRKETLEWSKLLNQLGFSARPYHAGLSFEERNLNQSLWVQNKVRIIVATNAFGMGIDKPDVRLVLHVYIPGRMESYYQEAGRAGRDGAKAYATIVASEAQVKEMMQSVHQSFPSVEYLKQIYLQLANHLQIPEGFESTEHTPLDLPTFNRKYNLKTTESYQALKILAKYGLIEFNEAFYRPSKIFVPDRTALYEVQVKSEKLTPLIKLLSRMYGGQMYTHAVVIQLKQLALALKTSEDSIHSQLLRLHLLQVVEYTPQLEGLTMRWMGQRHSVKSIPFDVNKYNAHRLHAVQMAQFMENYFFDTFTCRQVQISAYFGETLAKPCGICDHCLKNKNEVPKSVTDALLQAIDEEALRPEELHVKLHTIEEKLLADASRYLLESGKIVLRDGRFQVNKQ